MKLILLISCTICANFQQASGQCNLERIFRTPKDMSKVNFDHLELVERSDFDRFETSSAKPPTVETTNQPKVSNVANAQVLVRFGGGDEGHGSSHIMRIPPQARYFPGALPPEAYHQPQPLGYPHYYHPYPPPVPFAFPNYYYRDSDAHFLPPQLSEYFQRHPEFFEGAHHARGGQVFIQGRPLMREEVGGVLHIVKAKSPVVTSAKSPPADAVPVVVEEEIRNRTAKRSCHHQSKVGGTASTKCNVLSAEELIKPKKPLVSLEELLKKALVAYKGLNSTSTSKLHVSCPIVDRKGNDQVTVTVEAQECQENAQKGSKIKDIDNLTAIVAATEDPPLALPGPQLRGIELDVVDLKNSKMPLKANLDLDWSGVYPKRPQYTEVPAVVLYKRPILPPVAPLPIARAPELVWGQKLANYGLPSQDDVSYFFMPEPNVAVRPVGIHLPQYVTMIPRQDVVAVQAPQNDNVCPKCGQRHGGGNFCSHCGSPVTSYWPICAPKK